MTTVKKSLISSNRDTFLRYALTFCCLFVICFFFPYTGDDWAWGSQIGLERLHTHFRDYGGRYFGYCIVMILTRFPLVKAAVMAACLTGIAACLEKLVMGSYAFFLGLILIACAPKDLLRQAVIWTSGFSNYTTSTLCIVIFLLIALRLRKGASCLPETVFSYTGMFALGLFNSLIVENMTLCSLIVSIGASVWYLRKHKSVPMLLTIHTVAVMIGMTIMFSNSTYQNVFANTDTYRTMGGVGGTGLLERVSKNYFDVIYSELLLHNHILNITLFVLCLLNILLFPPRAGLLDITALTGFGSYTVYSLFSVYLTDQKSARLIHLEGWLTLLALLALFYLIIHISSKSSRKNRDESLLFLTALTFSVLPLLFVTPIGSRNFMTSYILFIALGCEMTQTLIHRIESFHNADLLVANAKVLLNRVLAGVLLFLGVFWTGLSFSFYRIDRGRLNHIRDHVEQGKTSIEILHFHNESFLWFATPETGSLWEYRYKLFYDIPQTIELKPVTSYSNQ